MLRGHSRWRIGAAAVVVAATVGLVGSPAVARPLLSRAAAPRYVFAFKQFPASEGDFPNAIWEVTSDGKTIRNVTPPSQDEPVSPRWSPNGKKLAVSDVTTRDLSQVSDVIVMHADGKHRVTLNGHGDCAGAIAWLHDGSAIACAAGATLDGSLFMRIVDTHGGASRRIHVAAPPEASRSIDAIDASPRDNRVVIDADGDYVISENGAVRATINEDGSFPRWSPDGKQLLFVEGGETIVATTAAGANRRVVLQVPSFAAVESAAWSPDGRQIAYIGNNGLHVVDVTTGNDRLLNPLAKLCGTSRAGCADLDWRR